jgi:hypothetical protein
LIFYLHYIEKELPLVIELRCEAAGCQKGQYIPPVQKFTTLSIVLIVVGSSAAFIALIISFGYVIQILRRYIYIYIYIF